VTALAVPLREIGYIEVMGSNPPFSPHGQQPFRAAPIPEILPPDGYTPPPPPAPEPTARRPRPRWAIAPATYTLLGINIAVYVLMVLARVSPVMPSADALMHWGANNAGSVLVDGEWWRIVTAMFVHGGILHLALNMWCLWNLGLLAEPLMGTFGLLAVYLLTGAAGNLLSTLSNWIQHWHDIPLVPTASAAFPPGVGASGAVFGIAGALIILLKSDRLPVPPVELKKIRKSVIYFAAINLVLGLGINFGTSRTGVAIDNMAHLGGCASGLLFAVPMVPRLGSPRSTFNLKLRIAVGMVTGILVLFGFFLSKMAP
jgi:rhomboid protease GluP